MEELIQTVADLGVGGCICLDARSLLPRNSVGRPSFRHRYLGLYLVHWEATGWIPPQFGAAVISETFMAPGVQDLIISVGVGGYAGIRLGGYGYLHLQAPEYGHTIYCDANYSGNFPRGVREAGFVGP